MTSKKPKKKRKEKPQALALPAPKESAIQIIEPPDEIVERVLSLSRDGLNRNQIHAWAADLPKKLERDVIDASIAKAAIALAGAANISSDFESGRSIARLNDLYARLHQSGDLRGCLAIQKELTKMLGLANTTKKQNERKVSAVKGITMQIVNIAQKYIHPNENQKFIDEVKKILEGGGLI